jgi:putative ABC transport system permease protein
MTAMLLRLSFAGIRARVTPALLTILLTAVAAGVVTLALSLTRVGDRPWDRTFAQTNGAHVLVYGSEHRVARVTSLAGVAEAAGPVPTVVTSFEPDGRRYGLQVIGLHLRLPTIERPVVTSGRWFGGPDEIVLERTFAETIGVRVGDSMRVKTTRGWIQVRVAGIAVLATAEPYPESQPGDAYADERLVARIQPNATRRNWVEALRLADPASSEAFIARARLRFPANAVFFDDWHSLRAEATRRNHTTTIVLSAYSMMLLIAVGFVLAVIVGSRVLERRHEVGLLKSVGLTPAQIVAVFLGEQLTLGLAGSVGGAIAGFALAPLLVRRSAELVGGVPISIDPVRLVLAVVLVELLVALVTLVPAARNARLAALHALQPSALRSPGRLARSLPLRTPIPAVVGFKDLLARPGRTIATTLALGLAVGALVAGLTGESTFRHEDAVDAKRAATATLPPDPSGLRPQRLDPVSVTDATREQVRPLVHGLNGVLVLVAIVNLLATALLAVRERVRDFGVLKAMGLTPRQILQSVLSAHAALGVGATLIGLPAGIGMFLGVYDIVNGNTELARIPAWWALVLVPACAAAAVALVAALPARRAALLTPAEALRYE